MYFSVSGNPEPLSLIAKPAKPGRDGPATTIPYRDRKNNFNHLPNVVMDLEGLPGNPVGQERAHFVSWSEETVR